MTALWVSLVVAGQIGLASLVGRVLRGPSDDFRQP